jgi:hypothetical protein
MMLKKQVPGYPGVWMNPGENPDEKGDYRGVIGKLLFLAHDEVCDQSDNPDDDDAGECRALGR